MRSGQKYDFAVQYIDDGALKNVLSIIPTKNDKNGTSFDGKIEFSIFPTKKQVCDLCIMPMPDKHFCAANTLLFFLRLSATHHFPTAAVKGRL